ncbi:hormone-sensitive lipase [Nomia melanderi]|uniref:hormone-sensitive lipase n=1 Tax=Nomia melanderi TaxID=2448451 RepID=UPI0013045CEF|nr:hormone-sensitive lipase [Nomia melanderi]XP_031830548.1 hormone-sensitive lipase [Nomia melanderi]XP_031830549.1 hormone-sensitive lipase [Nomia melanderi]XP_031830550.1 hormone-sensitive lipase [Nomia melanderi]XP_031830551.1 hormone-sensitive lipase [Nomia melanderi]XP_031830552.1 hormone-sensitive lipase [Nomia melanderi]XP_031830553.1 hormone-sensitive lipase [Nomia melanderi]XP_031830554.1 hormone-sensitive lipase [Nomia melanderi]XP_031830555.1 hormone-sensitive lipase [Nomia mela
MSLNDDFERPFEDCLPLQWGALQELCQANVEHFMSHQDENAVRIRAAQLAMLDHLEQLQPLYKEINRVAPMFDFDVEIPGNGYRSFLGLIDKCIIHSRAICHQIYCQKDSIFFRKSYHMREIEACSQLLASLCTCLEHLQTLYSWSDKLNDEKPSLFIASDHNPYDILNKIDSINQYCFYGRCLGFQFNDTMKPILKTILVCMATFSEAFYSNGTVLARCANSVKYMLDPEARARRIVDLFQRADVSFCQAFWFLNENEIARRLPTIASPSLAINQIISIPPEELTLSALDGTIVSIPIPNSHIGKKPIHVRLLSSKRRVGMIGSGGVGGELLESSKELIIHCHGGGFVAQTSSSHEIYLRSWAVNLDIPILSIDYSLAPEAPFPRAFEEVLYAYAWALNHASTLLGSTAQKVLLVGDSAGANLNLGVTLKCIQLNIKKPNGLFMAYTPVFVDFVLSPSRLLSLTDPLLPMGFLVRCLKAYAAIDNKKLAKEKENDGAECTKSDTESFAEVSESDLIALALSPNGDETNDAHKLASLPSDTTLNSVSLTDADVGTENITEGVKSQEYIKRFLELYRNSGINAAAYIGNSTVSTNNDVSKNGRSWSLFGWSFRGKHRESRELDIETVKCPVEEFIFTVPRDPFLSPYLAPDNLLAQLPPIAMLTLHLDPCLDDSVMFARKLRLLGVLVTLDILPGLPHGFLNLILVSKEANEGSELCVRRIQELLAL